MLQEALQLYDTPKSIRQALTGSDNYSDNSNFNKAHCEITNTDPCKPFSGPYANYDIPHAGAAPVPVFRKACGCMMKLVPESNVSQNFSGHSSLIGRHE